MENNQNGGVKTKKLDPTYFYEENGRKVMTEAYHINRGYCCGNRCRHCPFEPKGQKGNTTIKK
jgi:hypothetical protein